MPFTVITLSKTPNNIRGDLSKWMQEISTGVYVGNYNSRIREKIWERVIDNIGDGSATISYSDNNEIGYKFESYNSDISIIDSDGLPLVLIPIKEVKYNEKTRAGFSKQAKIRKAQKFRNNLVSSDRKFVVLDIETSGLDLKKDKIIEIGAILADTKGKIYKKFDKIIYQDIKLNKEIIELTSINDNMIKKGIEEEIALRELTDFISGNTIVGYNINFDLKFINYNLKKFDFVEIKNLRYDIMKSVKKENLFLKSYKLQEVIKEYGINKKVRHRALYDAMIILELALKVNEFSNKLK